jgi:hypothetical protein
MEEKHKVNICNVPDSTPEGFQARANKPKQHSSL